MPQTTPSSPAPDEADRPAEAADLILSAAWLLPFAGGLDATDSGAIEDGALALGNGRILAVGTRADMTARYPGTAQIALAQHVLMPGLVNAHGHAAMTLLRGSSEDAPLQAWLTEQIWPLEAKWVDESFCRDGIRIAMAEMIRSGVTSFADMYYFPEIGAEEARKAGLRAQLAFPVIEFPNAWSRNSEEGFHKGLALYDQYRNDPHINIDATGDELKQRRCWA